jgi:prepilin peptidase CpaA
MSLANMSQVSVLLAFVALLGWGAISDFSRYIIPNRVCLAIAALYPAHVLASGGAVDWQGGALLAAATFAAGCMLFAMRVLGGGDVKFISAIVPWAGPTLFWPFVITTALAGGVLALAVLCATRAWRPLAVRMIGMATGMGQEALPEGSRVPYGIAIAAGGFVVAMQLATSVILP